MGKGDGINAWCKQVTSSTAPLYPGYKFGHSGGNQPALNQIAGKVEITAQHHGVAVDATKLDTSKAHITHINLNDQTVEGMEHLQYPVFSVQYHPEASPGAHDSRDLFRRFINLIEEHKAMVA